MTTSAMARQRSLQPWISQTAPCWPTASRDIVTKSSLPFSRKSTRAFLLSWMCMSLRTTTALINTPKCGRGWQTTLGSPCITLPPTPHGSTRWSGGLGISLKKPFAETPFEAQKSLLARSKNSLPITMNMPGLSCGQPPLIQSSERSKRYVNLFVGQDTRLLIERISLPIAPPGTRLPQQLLCAKVTRYHQGGRIRQ